MEASASAGSQRLYPPERGDWQPSIRWIFTSALLTQPCSPFLCSLLTVWRRLQHHLSQPPPSCQEEIDRQPLIWSSLVTNCTGHQLGEWSHIPWADWARGPARLLQVWRDIFRQMDTAELAVAVGTTRGIQARRAEIDAAIPAQTSHSR